MAIDTEKMKALAEKVGAVEWYEAGDSVCLPDGDTIACCNSSIGHMPEPIHYDDMVEYLVSVSPAKILKLIAALESSKQEADALLSTIAECRDKAHVEGYGESFLYEAIACPDDVPAFIGQTVTELRAALEAAAADKRDAERYRGLFDALHRGDIPMKESSISLNVCGVPPDRDEFDEAVDLSISQRQEES
ncbi:hypothetical protein L0Z11_11510 [Burkholderia multivorans]|uniref:hypothetical protein n=1 Tax=Burkholderia multivorans TaxID=87883 RepID=UPI00201A078C|nr:hypothetical protein [Burkholderia multivorans]UQN68313.1 hypothetical protein L0Z45_11530 [Burkholderia multivorans]UQN74042.1 hypothetical protein L0Z11_11510 [Burkholderia multivorans]